MLSVKHYVSIQTEVIMLAYKLPFGNYASIL